MCAPWVCSSIEKVHSDACSSCLAAAAPFGCVFVVFAKAYERGDSFLSQHARATECRLWKWLDEEDWKLGNACYSSEEWRSNPRQAHCVLYEVC